MPTNSLYSFVSLRPLNAVDPTGLLDQLLDDWVEPDWTVDTHLCGAPISFDADDGGFDDEHVHVFAPDGSWVAEFSASGTIRSCGLCNEQTGKLNNFDPQVTFQALGATGGFGGWKCNKPTFNVNYSGLNCRIEKVTNGCGCHIDAEYGECTDGWVEVRASMTCKGVITGTKFTWNYGWEVRIPDTKIGPCCPSYAFGKEP